MLLTYFVPALVVLMMTIVGTGLCVEQFKIITRNSAGVLWSSLIGLLLLPAGALIIGNLLASLNCLFLEYISRILKLKPNIAFHLFRK